MDRNGIASWPWASLDCSVKGDSVGSIVWRHLVERDLLRFLIIFCIWILNSKHYLSIYNSDVATVCAQDKLAQSHVRAIRITANDHLPPSNIYLLFDHFFNHGDRKLQVLKRTYHRLSALRKIGSLK